MTKHMVPIFSLLFVSTFFMSCRGQTTSEYSTKTMVEQTFTSQNAKLTKTQGANEYQNVHCGLQDKAGILWFGTTGEGVYRYDGKVFTQYTEKDGLSNNTVWSILEDASGNIWFGTGNGISKYDGKTISSVPIVITKEGSSFPTISAKSTPPPTNAVWSMLQDKSGIIWFGTDNGLICFDGKKFTQFLDNPNVINKKGLSLKSVVSMYQAENGNLWFGSAFDIAEGLCLFDGKSITNFKPQNEGWIRKITAEKNGTLLLGTRHVGLIAYDGVTFSDYPAPKDLRKELLTATLVDNKGNIWFGSDYTDSRDISIGGVWKYDGTTFTEFGKKDGLSNTSVYSIIEDRAGNIWIGTRNMGLYRYDGKAFVSLSE